MKNPPIGVKFSVGRSPQNDVVMESPLTSRISFVFWVEEPGRVRIAGVMEANGVRVNGMSVLDGAVVDYTDVLEFGGTSITPLELVERATGRRHVFLSYGRADQRRAEVVRDTLTEAGWSVWWDQELRLAQRFDEQLETQLGLARGIVVLWSHTSIGSEWVVHEASAGLARGVLLPIFIDSVKAPAEFRDVQGFVATTWREDAAGLPVWDCDPHALRQAIERVVGPPRPE